MKTLILFSVLFLSGLFAQAAKVEFKAKLSPAGSFTATNGNVTGTAKKVGGKYIADNIQIQMDSFKTGIDLRDRHMAEKLEAAKFKHALCMNAEGQDGKGTAKIKIKDQEKTVSGIYEVKDNNLIATFTLNINDFGLSGVKYMGVGVKDEIDVTVEVPIVAAADVPPAAPPKALPTEKLPQTKSKAKRQ
jgi:hypothetical protein